MTIEKIRITTMKVSRDYSFVLYIVLFDSLKAYTLQGIP